MQRFVATLTGVRWHCQGLLYSAGSFSSRTNSAVSREGDRSGEPENYVVLFCADDDRMAHSRLVPSQQKLFCLWQLVQGQGPLARVNIEQNEIHFSESCFTGYAQVLKIPPFSNKSANNDSSLELVAFFYPVFLLTCLFFCICFIVTLSLTAFPLVCLSSLLLSSQGTSLN